MGKRITIILILSLVSLPVFSSGWGMEFNVNYNIGNSDFFSRTKTLYQSEGYNFLENKKNNLGIGFTTGIIIPVTSRLSVIPALTINFGHQSYEFLRQEGQSDSDIKENYSFLIYTGSLNANYDLFILKNGWQVTFLLGTGYNDFHVDGESGLKRTNFWGAKAGIGAKFFQLKNFGFQTFLIYNYPFNEKNFTYLTLKTGIIYRF